MQYRNPKNWTAQKDKRQGIYDFLIAFFYFELDLVWLSFLTIVGYLTPNTLHTFYIWFIYAKFVVNIF